MRFLCAILVVFIYSCQSNEGDVENPVVTYLTSKEFMISNYSSNGLDETQEFSGFIFKFHRNKTVTVEGNGQIITGSWEAYYVRFPDFISNYNALKLNFTNSALFQKLNKEWMVTLSGPNAVGVRVDFTYFLKFESTN